jgi:hypothetical protein
MTESDPEGAANPRSFRPALVALSEDVRERVEELQGGLDDEGRVLTWMQEITIRTLGQIDRHVYADLARNLRGKQGALVASLVRPAKRRDGMERIDESRAKATRERFLAEYIVPAHRRAFRNLRTDATEYVDAAGDADAHNPYRQSAIAMRPALNELDEWQARCLSRLLGGFEQRSDILDWSHDVLLATHGELPEEFVSRAYKEDGTVSMLTGDCDTDEEARRLFAASYVLPNFRSGVRVLSGRAGESADAESERSEVEFA